MRHDHRVPAAFQPTTRELARIAEIASRRLARIGMLAATLLTTTACESESVAVVHLSVGLRPDEHRSFQPKSSVAEYVELPGYGAELRVLLSSHPITCESYLPLEPDQVTVALTFSVPIGTQLGPGPYPWLGNKLDLPNAGEHPVPQVLPLIRLGKQAVELPPGGLAELTEVKLDAEGRVRGLLRLEQPGAAGLPATSLLGSFSARWCRIASMPTQ